MLLKLVLFRLLNDVDTPPKVLFLEKAKLCQRKKILLSIIRKILIEIKIVCKTIQMADTAAC